MIDSNETYSRSAAYKFLRILLDVPKGTIINKSFFNLFFQESDGVYFILKSENLVKNFFSEKGIKELNSLYFKKKEKGKDKKATKLAQKILTIVSESMKA